MNLFEGIPEKLPEELAQNLFKQKSLRIERIVSQGHSSEADFLYDQDEYEWVLVLQLGSEFEYESGEVKILKSGECELIPAGVKHRVNSSSVDPKCTWTAIFFEVDADV